MDNFDPKKYLENNKYIPSLETVNAANMVNMANAQLADMTQRQLAAEGYASLASPRGNSTQDGRVIIDALPNTETQNNARYKWNKETRNNGGGGNSNSPYIEQLNALYDQIMNRKPFQYDLNGDLLYRQMADQYTQLGQQAMRDTMGQAAALTGGYGNSYAQQVGNQAYQQYLTYLNEQIPGLYDRAYNVWQNEGDRLLERYQLAASHPGYLAALQPSSGGGGGAAADEEQTQAGNAAYTAALGGMGLLPTQGANGFVVVGDAANRYGWQPVATNTTETTAAETPAGTQTTETEAAPPGTMYGQLVNPLINNYYRLNNNYRLYDYFRPRLGK